MNMSKVVFGFFVLLALTLNFGFFLGEIDNPDHHNVYELFAALVVGLIATVMKLGERTQMSAMLLASSLVVEPAADRRCPGLGHLGACTGDRADACRHGDHRVAVRRGAAGQRAVGHPADHGNRRSQSLS